MTAASAARRGHEKRREPGSESRFSLSVRPRSGTTGERSVIARGAVGLNNLEHVNERRGADTERSPGPMRNVVLIDFSSSLQRRLACSQRRLAAGPVLPEVGSCVFRRIDGTRREAIAETPTPTPARSLRTVGDFPTLQAWWSVTATAVILGTLAFARLGPASVANLAPWSSGNWGLLR